MQFIYCEECLSENYRYVCVKLRGNAHRKFGQLLHNVQHFSAFDVLCLLDKSNSIIQQLSEIAHIYNDQAPIFINLFKHLRQKYYVRIQAPYKWQIAELQSIQSFNANFLEDLFIFEETVPKEFEGKAALVFKGEFVVVQIQKF
ncbi:Hypothetical_protein [Hexamita inflata]|uniref:Hypothetical_protein n=1 Tax=Hexamita inflata TaxID=28002 RepID=A0AA86RTI1_9EUKA|nr:Hypothetical protein HINF_LOCUS65437 [Hexamita inflata]